MRIQDFPSATLRKFRTPSTWGAILAFGVFWALLRLATGFRGALSSQGELLAPFILLTGNVALAPLPWLWTGDDRKQAPPTRGFLQAIPWNAAWLLAMTAFLIHVAPLRDLASKPEIAVQLPGIHLVLRPEWGMGFFNFPFTMIMGWFLAAKEVAEARERDIQALADRSRAQVLQAQLNPHVLFNVLAGLTELVHEDPDATEEALVGLVEMYRELTRHGTALTVSLARERALLKRYLGIEAIRLGERLKVEWLWPEWADALELPPLLLQPLVENAIKHGISPAAQGGILRIEVARREGALILRVANTGAALAAEPREGTGLGNMRERLTLMSQYEPGLDLRSDAGWTIAEITLGRMPG